LVEKVALIINSGSFERVSYALTVAAMYAAFGMEVYAFFTYGALFRLIKGRTDEVGEETDPTVRQKINEALEKGTIRSISEGIEELKRFGGRIYACIAAMSFYDVIRDELISEVDEVMGIAAFLEATRGAQIFYI
jgi:peroxiredoxin family protein